MKTVEQLYQQYANNPIGWMKANKCNDVRQGVIELMKQAIDNCPKQAIVNDVLVREGDLIASEALVDGEYITSEIPIVFENGCFWTDESFKKDGSHLHLLVEWDEPIKVVGNIYESNTVKP